MATYDFSSQTESFPPSPGGYILTIDGTDGTTDREQPFPLDISNFYDYRSGEGSTYSPSIGGSSPLSASSLSPGWFTDGDEFGNQNVDALTDVEFMKYLHNDPPDLNVANLSSIAISAPCIQRDRPSPPDFPRECFMDATKMGYQIPIQGTSNSPSFTHAALSHEGHGGPGGNHPVPLPPPAVPRVPRAYSAPSGGEQRPFMNHNQRDPFSEVFHPDSPDSPSFPPVVLDQLWDGFTLDGVPLAETGLVSLGPRHQVSERDFLSAPRPTHCRRRSDVVIRHESHLVSSGSADDLGQLQLAPQTAPASLDVFTGRPLKSLKALSVSLQVPSLQLPRIVHPGGGDVAWEGPSSSQGVFSASSGTPSLNSGSFEDESQARADDAEEPPISPGVFKRHVTTRAVRIASNARMRSHSRFPCPLCPQCLTTKGGLRNHFNSHIGLKRFNCSERNCGKAFTTKWVCTRHERTVHGLLR